MEVRTQQLPDPPSLDDDPFSPGTLANCAAWFAKLRETGPIVWLNKYSVYATGRFEDVEAVLRNWRQFTNSSGPGMSDTRKPDHWRKPGIIAEADPPRHTQIRATMNKILSPRVIRGWQDMFEREAVRVVDQVLQKQCFDAVSELVEPYVAQVFPDAFGTRMKNRENLLILGDHGFNANGPRNELFQASAARMAAIQAWNDASHTRESLLPGGFGEAIFLAEDAGDLPPGAGLSMLVTFMRGGLDTTIGGISSLLWYLARHPDQWKILKEDPALIGNAFEEAVRLEAPINTMFRATAGEVEYKGCALKADTKVMMSLGAANRDPSRWEHPDEFEVRRNVSGYIAFGAGIHNCLGKMTSKLEAQSLVGEIVKRVRSLQIDGPVEHRRNNTLRALQRLSLRVTLQ